MWSRSWLMCSTPTEGERVNEIDVMIAVEQGWAKRWSPGCENFSSKLRQKWYQTAGTEFTKHGANESLSHIGLYNVEWTQIVSIFDLADVPHGHVRLHGGGVCGQGRLARLRLPTRH